MLAERDEFGFPSFDAAHNPSAWSFEDFNVVHVSNYAFHSPFEVFAATLASASQPQDAKH